MSDKTAFVGFPYANDYTGTVLFYEQSEFGEREEVEDPFVHDANVNKASTLGGMFILRGIWLVWEMAVDFTFITGVTKSGCSLI